MSAPKPLPRCCEMDDAIDRAERCTAGHGGALCDRCFRLVVQAQPSPGSAYNLPRLAWRRLAGGRK